MGAKESQNLKSLETRLTKKKEEERHAAQEASEAQKKLANIKKGVSSLQRQIDTVKLLSKEPVVTEHAVLRYVERVMGFNIEQIKEEILSDSMKSQIKTLGNGKYPVGEGCKAVVRDNTIVTIH